MRLLLIIIGVIFAVVILAAAIVTVIGYYLPIKHTASNSVRIDRPISEVYKTVRNFESSPEWRPNVASVEIIGTAENSHLQFRERSGGDDVTYELLEDEPERRIVTRIVNTDLGYSGSWTYEFSADDNHTILTITENGEVSNPIFRFLSRYVFGHTATIDNYLKALAGHLNK